MTKTVYIIDDDPTMCFYVKKLVESIGKSLAIGGDTIELVVETFQEPYMAISQMRNEQVDVVILDYHLGEAVVEITGEMVLKDLRNLDPLVRVIMLSGARDAKVVKRLMDLGIENYIMKDDCMENELRYSLHEELFLGLLNAG